MPQRNSPPLVRVDRAAFEDGRAECLFCGAYVRPVGETTRLLMHRVFGADAEAGECPVCGLLTYFRLT